MADGANQAEASLFSLYADFAVEPLILRATSIHSGYLDTADFKRRLAEAFFAPFA